MSHAVSFVAAAFGPDAEFEGRIVAEVERFESSGMLRGELAPEPVEARGR